MSHNLDTYHQHMEEIRDYLEERLSVSTQCTVCFDNTMCLMTQKQFGDGVHFNGRFPDVKRIPNTCNVSLIGQQFQGMCHSLSR